MSILVAKNNKHFSSKKICLFWNNFNNSEYKNKNIYLKSILKAKISQQMQLNNDPKKINVNCNCNKCGNLEM